MSLEVDCLPADLLASQSMENHSSLEARGARTRWGHTQPPSHGLGSGTGCDYGGDDAGIAHGERGADSALQLRLRQQLCCQPASCGYRPPSHLLLRLLLCCC